MFVDRSVCVDLLKVCAIKMSFPWCSNFIYLLMECTVNTSEPFIVFLNMYVNCYKAVCVSMGK